MGLEDYDWFLLGSLNVCAKFHDYAIVVIYLWVTSDGKVFQSGFKIK